MPTTEAEGDLDKTNDGDTSLQQTTASSSQADTEPLEFEDDADAEGEMDEQQEDQDMLETSATLAQTEEQPNGIPSTQTDTAQGEGELGQDVDTSMGNEMALDEMGDEDADADADADANGDSDADGEGEEDAMGSDEDEQGNEDGESAIVDALPGSQATTGTLSPSKVAAGGANFSDESDLTDEPDDDDDDAEGEDEEDDEEEDDDEDEDDEDEAAKGLAALTGAQTTSVDDEEATAGQTGVNSGLDGLAVIAAAEAGDESQAEEDTDNDSISGTAANPLKGKGRKRHSAASRRTATRLNEVMVASTQGSEEENDEEEEDEEEEEEDEVEGEGGEVQEGIVNTIVTPSKSANREMSSLIGLASAAKRNAKPGAAGLLAGAPSITIEGAASIAPSAATSREASPNEEDGEQVEEGSAVEAEEAEETKEETEQDKEEPGTPAQDLDEVGPEDEPATDEAAMKRQEAMEALTKIEIGFALLRDKLYVERMDEVSKEGEMILDGTHPDLIYLSNLIEERRERKLKLVDKWFEQQEKQYERVAKAEEAAAWNNWRNEVVELRKEQMNDVSRKRRKLDREKRTLDGPRPARRHQIFETELVRNPDYDRKMQIQNRSKKGKTKDEVEDIGAYVAFPDLRGADDHESWMDMERMGIATDSRFIPNMAPTFYRPEEVGMDPYAMYAMEQPQSGPSSSGFVAFGGGPPPPPSDFGGPYDRQFDGRSGMGGGQQSLPTYVDGYGRQVSPPPPSHVYGNSSASLQQRSGNRMQEAYAPPLEHHSHRQQAPSQSYPSNRKANRRASPPLAMEDRDVKLFAKNIDNGINRSSAYSSNPSAVPRPPSSQYAKYGNNRNTEESFYKSTNANGNTNSKDSMNNSGPSPHSNAIRPKGGAMASQNSDIGNSAFANRRAQEHMYSR